MPDRSILKVKAFQCSGQKHFGGRRGPPCQIGLLRWGEGAQRGMFGFKIRTYKRHERYQADQFLLLRYLTERISAWSFLNAGFHCVWRQRV